jgi:hypothetical protein
MADAAATNSSKAGAPVKRQAVVLIHGMGEQSPMETILGFADSVWSKDADLHASAPTDDRDRKMGELFHVPDLCTGSRELRRISTRKSKTRTSESSGSLEDSVRTDFFELYWADATRDSTWSDFVAWYWRLLLRTPSNVPSGVFWVWVWLIALTSLLVLLTVVVVLWWPIHAGTDAGRADGLTAAGRVFLDAAAVVGLALLAKRFVSRPEFGWLLTWIMYTAVAFAAIGGACYAATWAYTQWHGAIERYYVWVALALLVVYAFGMTIAGFLVRFFGDVARYCLATPGNIAARKEIRERGIRLLNHLHSDPQYERIVLVGHSLGTIVAYDILTFLWSDYASRQATDEDHKDAAMQPCVVEGSALWAALEECRRAAIKLDNSPRPDLLLRFRAAQRGVYAQLRAAGQPAAAADDVPQDGKHQFRRWLISDLVTIACPLTHAEFLLAPNGKALAERFRRRELSTCPPAMEQSANDWRLTYLDKDKKHRLIHDAAFAAVRWTNIFDKPESRFLFLFGDVISGPVNSLFGRRIPKKSDKSGNDDKRNQVVPEDARRPARSDPAEKDEKLDTMNYGILDIPVQPEHDGSVLPTRLFTHNRYWDWQEEASAAQLDSVVVVREAINLLDLKEVEARLVNRAC